MQRNRSTSLLTAAFSAALLLSGCNKSTPPPPPGSQPAQPSQGQAAPTPVAPATSAADAPVAPGTTAAPATPAVPGTAISPAPAPVAATPAPKPALVVPAHTRVTIRTTESLSAEHNDVGQSFSGVLNAPIVVHGTTAFKRGTEVRGQIVSAKGRGRFKGAGVLGVELVSIGGYRVGTTEYVQRTKGRGKRTAGFIGGGAGVGTLIGGLAGGGKGALIGGLTGAGAGTAAGAYTGKRDVVIPSETAISFTTTTPIKLN